MSRMLAVHEQRITKQEEIDAVLFDKIDKLRDKMDSDHDIVTQRLSLLERKLWIGIGILGAVVAFTNPQAIKTLRPLLSSAESAIVRTSGCLCEWIILIPSLLDSYLTVRKIQESKGKSYNFRCPICGDSKKNKSKTRGYLYAVKANTNFKCHNCGASMSLTTFERSRSCYP